ncbi:MAG: 3-phosphoshikimate 1-carboxyvinyltransferase [Methylobacteriaceae bacterium]|nr:3-phosphoshikimate 1-carboxyvinyltransferase [Methylobacteriaceae bacterium]
MSATDSPVPAASRPGSRLHGTIRVPGDKSVSHRALILGLLAIGETRIDGLLEGDDVLHTARACVALGASVERLGEGSWRVRGAGLGGLVEPVETLDFGNAGTGTRLMMGVAGSHPITVTFDGDESLRKRPMRRILDPLRLMGTRVLNEAEGGRLPVTLRGPDAAIPVTYTLPTPSAQVKSAVLLAGLNSPGVTTVIEPQPTRDHTERLLRLFGADVSTAPHPGGGNAVSVQGFPALRGTSVTVPSDPSSAAFPLVAALIVPGSDVVIENVMMNPTRTGLLTTLREMGADITPENPRDEGGEAVADLHVRSSGLKGVEVPAGRAPSMIDEYPILAVAAAFAEGRTVLRGLHELRVKESDRLAAIAAGLKEAGVPYTVAGDDLTIEGGGGRAPGGGGVIRTHMDHRIAMAFLILGLAAQNGARIDDSSMIATSFPNFISLMRELGADISG